jgi:hypothetical protein
MRINHLLLWGLFYRQTSAVLMLPLAGVVICMFGSLSQTTLPSASFRMYLYCTCVSTGSCAVTLHTGYATALSVSAASGDQFASASTEPVRKTFSPYDVVAFTRNVTLAVGAAGPGLHDAGTLRPAAPQDAGGSVVLRALKA